jgi:peptidoglycan/LPS O-acetylase OafA/YrhL
MWLGFHDAEAVMYGTMIVLFLSINKYNFLALPEKVFSKFGEFSYSMYWVHFPVIKALCVLMRAHGILWPGPFSHVFIAWGIIIMPCIVILSGFSYTFFEKPFLQFRHKYN